MYFVPARCERSREWISLRLDDQLSTFEAALLERHLRRCAPCRAFAASATQQTQLLRGAALEQLSRPIELPAPARRPLRKPAIGVVLASTVAAAAAALATLGLPSLVPGGGRAEANAKIAQPTMVVYAAKPDPASHVEVPRLKVVPASIADGPVHGKFSLPA